MVGLARLDVGDQGAQGVEGVGEETILLADDGYVTAAWSQGCGPEQSRRYGTPWERGPGYHRPVSDHVVLQ